MNEKQRKKEKQWPVCLCGSQKSAFNLLGPIIQSLFRSTGGMLILSHISPGMAKLTRELHVFLVIIVQCGNLSNYKFQNVTKEKPPAI